MRTFARLLALSLLTLSAACMPAAPTMPTDPFAASEGTYRLGTANSVAMPGTLSFPDGVSFTYSDGTHIRLAGHKYEMVLDYVARDGSGSYPWVWQMQGEYTVEGDTITLDPNGGDMNGQKLILRDHALQVDFASAKRVRSMTFAR